MASPSEEKSDQAPKSAQSGLLKHGEHLADILLDVGPGIEEGRFHALESYQHILARVIDGVAAGSFETVNEKIDGSPAIVLGFDEAQAPFVAYKGGIGRKGEDLIVRSVAEAESAYSADHPMRAILSDAITLLETGLAHFGDTSLVFQADLLFSPGTDRRTVEDDRVLIQANPHGIRYEIERGHELFEAVSRAKIGLVVHTVAERGPDESLLPLRDQQSIENLIDCLQSEEVFAIGPWKRNVELDQSSAPFDQEDELEAKQTLRRISFLISSLSDPFREAWETFHPRFRTFLNSSLKPGADGGIFSQAADGTSFDAMTFVDAFEEWIETRANTLRISRRGSKSTLEPKSLPQRFSEFREEFDGELENLVHGFYLANRLQYALKPSMQEVYQSKLGGGPSEGAMLHSSGSVVKLVDRLDFTRKNFSGESSRMRGKRIAARRAPRKRGESAQSTTSKSFFEQWPADSIVYIGKFQPPHQGHVEIMRKLAANAEGRRVIVLASNKEPNYGAERWNQSNLADRKMDLKAGKLKYPFPLEFRQELLEHAVPEGVELVIANPFDFWQRVKRASRDGETRSVLFATGEKEISEGRYRHQFETYAGLIEPFALPMERGSLSATQVRNAIASLSDQGSHDAYELLVSALEYIPSKQRDRLIGEMLYQWRAARDFATSLVS